MQCEKIGLCTLYHADCCEALPSFADKSIDHVISDPPYESNYQKSFGSIRAKNRPGLGKEISFDGIEAVLDFVALQSVRVTKKWMLFFCTPEGVAAWRDSITRSEGKYDIPLAWIKPDAMPRFNGQGAGRGFECIVTARRISGRLRLVSFRHIRNCANSFTCAAT